MGRRRGGTNKPKQTFAFPSEEQPVAGTEQLTDEQLDRAIDTGEFPPEVKVEQPSEAVRVEQIRQKYQKKKDLVQLAKEIPEIIKPEQVAWVFDIYELALSFVLSIALKADYAVIHEELKMDEDQKLVFAKPLARIANKYVPTEWASYSAEIELITTMGIYTATSYGRAQTALRKAKRDQNHVSQQQPHVAERQAAVV
jgi:hypothetical protein